MQSRYHYPKFLSTKQTQKMAEPSAQPLAKCNQRRRPLRKSTLPPDETFCRFVGEPSNLAFGQSEPAVLPAWRLLTPASLCLSPKPGELRQQYRTLPPGVLPFFNTLAVNINQSFRKFS